MINIIKIGLWLKLSDKQIDFLLDIYCKIKYHLSFNEILSIVAELKKDE